MLKRRGVVGCRSGTRRRAQDFNCRRCGALECPGARVGWPAWWNATLLRAAARQLAGADSLANLDCSRLEPGLWALRNSVGCDSLPIMKATWPEPEIVTRKGKPVSVILPIKDYEELLERVEDAADVAWLKRARKKPLRYRPLEEYLAERKVK